MRKTPLIKVAFWIEGYEFDLDKATEAVGVLPTWASTRKEAPPKAIRGTCWSFAIEREKSYDATVQMQKVIDQICLRKNKIIEFCSDHNLEVGFNVHITMYGANRPVISFPVHQVRFISSLNAMINIELAL